MSEWTDYVARAERTHGEKLDLSEINQAFVPYFRGPRIKVRVWGDEMTGTVGITTGWKPALLLMRRSSDHGSVYLLESDAELVAVQRGRTYVPVVAS